jgi:hypothetical protein
VTRRSRSRHSHRDGHGNTTSTSRNTPGRARRRRPGRLASESDSESSFCPFRRPAGRPCGRRPALGHRRGGTGRLSVRVRVTGTVTSSESRSQLGSGSVANPASCSPAAGGHVGQWLWPGLDSCCCMNGTWCVSDAHFSRQSLTALGSFFEFPLKPTQLSGPNQLTFFLD